MPLPKTFLKLCIVDKNIKWESYDAQKERVCSRFESKEWRKIISGIHTDQEWNEFLTRLAGYTHCFVLYPSERNTPIAFILLMQEDEKGKVISIHGGGWDKSVRLSLLYYRGLIVMIEHLLKQGFKVRTSCLIANERAFRFLRSVGFVKYYSTDTKHLMWINAKRLESSSIYKRIMQ